MSLVYLFFLVYFPFRWEDSYEDKIWIHISAAIVQDWNGFQLTVVAEKSLQYFYHEQIQHLFISNTKKYDYEVRSVLLLVI